MQKVEAGKVSIAWNNTVDEILGDESGVTSVRIKNTQNGELSTVDATGCFIAIGHEPNTGIFAGQLPMENGYLKVQSGMTQFATATSIPGVFAAGDVSDFTYRQAITAAGMGCMAALDAQRYLEK